MVRTYTRAKLRLVFLQSGNLICSSFAIAREFDFHAACGNIRVFQISDKSGWPFELLQNRVAGLQPTEWAFRIFESLVTPIDFKGRGSQSARESRRVVG